MENSPKDALRLLTLGPGPITAADLLHARAEAMGMINLAIQPIPLTMPIARSPDLDRMLTSPIEEIPYSRPPARRHKGYQEPDQHNNMQANRAAAVRSAKAKKKATAEMKKKARRRG